LHNIQKKGKLAREHGATDHEITRSYLRVSAGLRPNALAFQDLDARRRLSPNNSESFMEWVLVCNQNMTAERDGEVLRPQAKRKADDSERVSDTDIAGDGDQW
jgi:hypothetical protein